MERRKEVEGGTWNGQNLKQRAIKTATKAGEYRKKVQARNPSTTRKEKSDRCTADGI
jgi:hypothetical protein